MTDYPELSPVEKLQKAHEYADQLASNSWGSYEAGIFMGLTIAMQIISPSEELAVWVRNDDSFEDFMRFMRIIND